MMSTLNSHAFVGSVSEHALNRATPWDAFLPAPSFPSRALPQSVRVPPRSTKNRLEYPFRCHYTGSFYKYIKSFVCPPIQLEVRLSMRFEMAAALERVEKLAAENAVVIFSVSSCCMCHAVKRLLGGMGVNPTVYELDEDPLGAEMEQIFSQLLGGPSPVPVVFIGGKLVGAMDSVMAAHISGALVPLLKDAGALWL